jgi:hypothetical protein
MAALFCPNNIQNDYRSDDYDSEKQIYLQWIIERQNVSKSFTTNSQNQAEKLLIRELEC